MRKGDIISSGFSYLSECGVLGVICLLPGSTTTFYKADEIGSTLSFITTPEVRSWAGERKKVMAVSAKDLGLKLMIDPQDYVVLCNKGQEKENNKIIYIALRTEFSNILLEDDIALLPLAFANIENNEVRLFHDANGQVTNTIFMYKKKSDLTEIKL